MKKYELYIHPLEGDEVLHDLEGSAEYAIQELFKLSREHINLEDSPVLIFTYNEHHSKQRHEFDAARPVIIEHLTKCMEPIAMTFADDIESNIASPVLSITACKTYDEAYDIATMYREPSGLAHEELNVSSILVQLQMEGDNIITSATTTKKMAPQEVLAGLLGLTLFAIEEEGYSPEQIIEEITKRFVK